MSFSREVCVLCAMHAEAETLAETGLQAMVCGIGPDRVRIALAEAAGRSVRVVVSWGVAGGLSPELRSGTVVRPRYVLDSAGASWETHTPAADGAILSVAAPVTSAVEKNGLWKRSGALAVDMESAAVAAYCKAQGIRLVVVRAICDPARRSVPQDTLDFVERDGKLRPVNVAARIIRHPTVVPGLIRAGIDFQRALRALRAEAAGLLSLAAGVA